MRRFVPNTLSHRRQSEGTASNCLCNTQIRHAESYPKDSVCMHPAVSRSSGHRKVPMNTEVRSYALSPGEMFAYHQHRVAGLAELFGPVLDQCTSLAPTVLLPSLQFLA